MQISHVRVVPAELDLRVPFRFAQRPPIEHIAVVFIQIETRQSKVAWGCAVFDPNLTGETMETVTRACQACADRALDLNPLNTEYALDELAALTEHTPSAQCAFEIAFYDLLGLAAGMPLHRLLGGFRDRILTSVTLEVNSIKETVATARQRSRQGFRILKIKGGLDAELDVRRVQAVHAALPHCILRLDADQGYSIQQAIDVARALENVIEMLEQPIPADDLIALRQVTAHSSVPILADESVTGPASALALAGGRMANGLSVKLATCGGLRSARQIDAVARSAKLATMVGCTIEPGLLIAAGLGFALSSPNVRYGDLDGHLFLAKDPSEPHFVLEDGWLIASDVPGLGCTVAL